MSTFESGDWQVVSTGQGFEELRAEWDELYRENPDHSPFQAWGWVSAWLEHLAGPHELRIICWRNEAGKLQFVLPLIERKNIDQSSLRRFVLACSYGVECSDHIGCLRLTSQESHLAEITATALSRFLGGGDRIELGHLSGADGYPGKVESRMKDEGRLVRLTDQATCPAVNLPSSWEEYLKKLSANFRSQVRRSYKRVGNDDNLKLQSVKVADAGTFVQELIRLNRTRIAHKGQVSSLENENFRKFLQDAIPMMAADGTAWMDVLTDEGRVVATALNFVQGRTVYYYMGGFDDSAKSLRPGTALFAMAIIRSIENGYLRYDFLRGAEQYKYRWGATDTSNFHIDIYPRGFLHGHMTYVVDGVLIRARNVARQIKHKYRDLSGNS
jgi:CelD/BcsL family acetyltransferase involved in cellulose biosynthesis